MDTQITSPIQPSRTKRVITSIVVLLVLGIMVTGVIYYWRQSRDLESTSTTTDPTQETLPEWTLYTNKEKGYTIKYPSLWRKVEGEFIGFGPASSGEDVIWTINTYPPETTTASIAEKIGAQFSDRIEKIETIEHAVDSAAQKIIVTTPSQPDWETVVVILKNKDVIYALSNGGIKDEALWKMPKNSAAINFETFYKSFALTNSEEAKRSELGTVAGKLCPSPEGGETGDIIAKNTDNDERTIKKIETPADNYTLILSPGEYKLRFQALNEQGGLSYGYYTEKKTLKPIKVTAGSSISNVDLCDYGSDDTAYQQQLGSSF